MTRPEEYAAVRSFLAHLEHGPVSTTDAARATTFPADWTELLSLTYWARKLGVGLVDGRWHTAFQHADVAAAQQADTVTVETRNIRTVTERRVGEMTFDPVRPLTLREWAVIRRCANRQVLAHRVSDTALVDAVDAVVRLGYLIPVGGSVGDSLGQSDLYRLSERGWEMLSQQPWFDAARA